MGMPEPVVDPSVEAVEPEAVEIPDELLVVAEPHPEEAMEPPPSKAELEDVFGHGIWSGLMPGVSTSVAPSGIPPEPEAEDGSDSTVPSGEVAPMPGLGAACAPAAVTPANHMIAAKACLPRIKLSSRCGYFASWVNVSTTVLLNTTAFKSSTSSAYFAIPRTHLSIHKPIRPIGFLYPNRRPCRISCLMTVRVMPVVKGFLQDNEAYRNIASRAEPNENFMLEFARRLHADASRLFDVDESVECQIALAIFRTIDLRRC